MFVLCLRAKASAQTLSGSSGPVKRACPVPKTCWHRQLGRARAAQLAQRSCPAFADHSAFTPLAFTTPSYFASSLLTKAANCSDVVGAGSASKGVKRALISAESGASTRIDEGAVQALRHVGRQPYGDRADRERGVDARPGNRMRPRRYRGGSLLARMRPQAVAGVRFRQASAHGARARRRWRADGRSRGRTSPAEARPGPRPSAGRHR